MAVRDRSSLFIVPTVSVRTKPTDRAEIQIYRPFFLAGILSVLTAGCLLGAVALLGISLNASYTASAWTPYVLAHANSQVYGWVGFFIMGFALQQHAPPLSKERMFHRLAYASLISVALGIALRFAAEPLTHVDRGLWVPIGVAACALQTLGVLLFVVNASANRHRDAGKLGWNGAFVFASLFWLSIVACAEPFIFALSHQADATRSILFVAQWFSPYREAQFLGFVSMMIFGVAAAKLSSCFGFREADRSMGLLGFGLWLSGIVARIVGWAVAFDRSFAGPAVGLYRFSAMLLALGALAITVSLGVFRPASIAHRSHKFLRAAFGWLLVAGFLMLLEPLHLAALGAPFSHAYTGAIRHALTVGFISQTILGVALLVVARLSRLDESKLPALWSAFWLLNFGNAARVGFEIGTDYAPGVFFPMGFTGFVELIALGIWAWAIVPPLLRRPRFAAG